MKKRIITITLVTLLVLSIVGFASASGISITGYSSSTTRIGSGQASLSAYTSTNENANSIRHTMQLQRFSGGSWSNYSSSVTRYGYGIKSFSSYSSKSVSSGYYYRTVTTHVATPYSGSSVTRYSSSASTWVN